MLILFFQLEETHQYALILSYQGNNHRTLSQIPSLQRDGYSSLR